MCSDLAVVSLQAVGVRIRLARIPVLPLRLCLGIPKALEYLEPLLFELTYPIAKGCNLIKRRGRGCDGRSNRPAASHEKKRRVPGLLDRSALVCGEVPQGFELRLVHKPLPSGRTQATMLDNTRGG